MAGYVYKGAVLDANLPEPWTRQPRRTGPAQCGTTSGYANHRTLREPVCGPCADARNAYKREWKIRRKAGKVVHQWTPDKCGTSAGYSAHRSYNTPQCDPCLSAERKRAQGRRAKRKVT